MGCLQDTADVKTSVPSYVVLGYDTVSVLALAVALMTEVVGQREKKPTYGLADSLVEQTLARPTAPDPGMCLSAVSERSAIAAPWAISNNRSASRP
jgi:hypothetical protein